MRKGEPGLIGCFANGVFLDGEIFKLRKVFDVVDPEVVHELLRRTVEHRAPNGVGFAFYFDQFLLQ